MELSGSSMMRAIIEDDEQSFNLYLDGQIDVNYEDDYGLSLLACAIMFDRRNMVYSLIEHGANLNNSGFHDIPAVLLAPFYGRLGLMLFFEKLKIDYLSASSGWGDTALIYASKRNHLNIAKYLLDKGANVDHQNNFGVTPLIAASTVGNIELAQLLIRRGASVELSDNLGRTPLKHAVRCYVQREYLKLLLDAGANISTRDIKGRSVFCHPGAIKYLDQFLQTNLWPNRKIIENGRERAFIQKCIQEKKDPLDVLMEKDQ